VFYLSLRVLTRAALLLALTLLFQSLRFFIPVPAAFSTLLIGSLVNACLLIALMTAGFGPAFLIAIITPLVAYMQAMLPLPIFVLPVAGGNILYITFYRLLARSPKWQAILTASFCKMIWLYFVFMFLLSLLSLPAKMSALLMAAMSWPQFVTGCIGGALSVLITKRIKRLAK
jgi:hypothetical protein